ncbi:AdoMet-dependent rRNA methyltransferase spb1 [Coelomomyces lativittatus]|nr:AdoMet-dependent rRNA methyltransferase spb1 [Coelomomyces lativittatus]KAJ1513787.1 AdoMet-dependent rRNA methyltransferase spb1 [Coelomomyces lativittatus]KAJ1515582.1 AdoMet-dependent rRNA methyltransferase spb1 [Coelomomyces lativittatus]
MGKKTKTGKSRLDAYYYLAKEQGYRSRAAFKLIQLNKKHAFLNHAKVVIDLCAAPGGWCQVIQQHTPPGTLILGIDRVSIAPIPNCVFHQSDIQQCLPWIQRTLLSHPLTTASMQVDVVVHDGAPNVGVEWQHDAYLQSELVLMALKVCTQVLKRNGVFVTKVFRCKEYTYLLWVLHQLFSKVEATKPDASRKVSAEIYIVCKGYLKPDVLDPKLVDPKFVFKEIDLNLNQRHASSKVKNQKNDSHEACSSASNPSLSIEGDENLETTTQSSRLLSSQSLLTSVFTPSQSRRHREGYEDTSTGLLYRALPMDQFIEHSDPTHVLASHHAFLFPSTSVYFPYVTPEIQVLGQDLQVLGKKEYKRLLKWRKHVREQTQLDPSSSSSSTISQEKNKTLLSELEREKEKVDKDDDVSLEEKVKRMDKQKELALKRTLRKRQAKLAQTHMKFTWAAPSSSSSSVAEFVEDELGTPSLFFDRPLFKEAQWNLLSMQEDKKVQENEEDEVEEVEVEEEMEEMEEEEEENVIDTKNVWDLKEEEEEEMMGSDTDVSETSQVAHDDDDDEVMLSDVSMEGDEDGRLQPSQKQGKLALTNPLKYTLAQQLIQHKTGSSPLSLVDASFHRYAHGEDEDLPSWFSSARGGGPLTHAVQVSDTVKQVYASRHQPVHARTIKKVVEAQWRKQKRKHQHLLHQNQQAHRVAQSQDVNEATKVKTIAQVFAKSQAKVRGLERRRRQVQLVVAKGGNKKVPGRPKGVQGRYKMVDKRMKKEKRASQRQADKKKKRRK